MVGGFLFLSLLALTCAGACSCMISAFAGRFIEEKEEGDRRYTELTRLEDQDGLLAEGEGVTEEGRAFIPRVKVVIKTPAHKYLSGCASACCVGSVLVVLGFLGAVMFFYPAVPSYSVCTTTFDWGALLRGMEVVQARLEYDVLISVENTNRFAINITDVDCVFKYGDSEVGTLRLDSSQSPSSSSDTARCVASWLARTFPSPRLDLVSCPKRATIPLVHNLTP